MSSSAELALGLLRLRVSGLVLVVSVPASESAAALGAVAVRACVSAVLATPPAELVKPVAAPDCVWVGGTAALAGPGVGARWGAPSPSSLIAILSIVLAGRANAAKEDEKEPSTHGTFRELAGAPCPADRAPSCGSS